MVPKFTKGARKMGRLISQMPCPKCSKSGAGSSLAVYTDGSYCMECGYKENTSEITPTKTRRPLPLVLDFHYQSIPSRKLSRKTCQKYGIGVTKYTGRFGKEEVSDHPSLVLNRFDASHGIQTQKIRDPKLRGLCTLRGDTSNMSLFGMHAFSPSDKIFCVVTVGELDAPSIYEATGYPAVSVNNGDGSARKELAENLEWLLGWKYIILAFDSDESAQKAAKSCLELFEPGQVRTCVFPLKDASEMLQAGRADDMKKTLWHAQEYRPKGIVTFADLKDRILQFPTMGPSWPWKGLTEQTYGVQKGEILVFAGGTGTGKTTLVTDIINHLVVSNNMNVGLCSAEQSPDDTFRRLLGLNTGINVNQLGVEIDSQLLLSAGPLFDDKLFCYDRQGIFSTDQVVTFINYAVKAKNCSVIIIDNMKALAASMPDEMKSMSTAIAKFQALCKNLNITIILLSHLAKDKRLGSAGGTDDSWRSGRVPVLENVYGTSALEAASDYVFGLSRNSNSDDPEVQKRLHLQCLKSGRRDMPSGRMFTLTYDLARSTLIEEQGLLQENNSDEI